MVRDAQAVDARDEGFDEVTHIRFVPGPFVDTHHAASVADAAAPAAARHDGVLPAAEEFARALTYSFVSDK
jgi:hypothetical protein